MQTDPFFDTLATVIPIVLLALLGVACIYSVIGVPVGIILLGVAIGLGVAAVRNNRHELPHH